MYGHDIIVIGASAGGVDALVKLAHDLPVSLPAAVFVVLHIPAQSPSLLPTILNRAGPLKALHPTNNMKIERGHIYIAPPDQHLLVKEGYVQIVRGPKENRHRPAVDPTLRSAALAYGPRVIGTILTGALDDGTAGLQAVKQRGGLAVVQDPQDALYPSMPQSAIEHVQVDYCIPLAEMGPLLTQLSHQPAGAESSYPASKELENEVKIAEMNMAALNTDDHPGKPSVLGCPECGGVLWELQEGDLLRFRCRTGHTFSPESVLAEQNEELERALWVALKTLEEKASLSRRMMHQAQEHGRDWMARNFKERLQEAEKYAGVIREMLMNNHSSTKEVSLDQTNGHRTEEDPAPE
jgi:two-component system chemotaxis response regulator CheB